MLHKRLITEISGAGILLGFLGWLGVSVFNMNGVISSMNTQLGDNANRIERIAKVLPEMGRRIASEEIYRPIEGVVLSSKPTLSKDGAWHTTVTLMNASKKVNTIYKVKLSSEKDKTASYLLTGSIKEYSPRSPSLATLEKLSYELDKPTVFPDYIDTNSSYVLRDYDSDKFLQVFEELKPHMKKERKEKLRKVVNTVEKLSAELVKNSEKYKRK